MDDTAAGRLRVLVVDDDEMVREFVCFIMAQQGYETAEAGDAASAMVQLSQGRFHAVITDKNMPGTAYPTEGGLDVVRYAKQVNPGCAVLMMTSYASVESAIKAMQFGAFDYVAKPVQAEDLVAKFARVLQYQQTIDPAGAFNAHDGFRGEFLALLEEGKGCHHLDDASKERLLAVIQGKIDLFFRERQSWERIVFDQREALAQIAGWAAQLQELLPGESQEGELAARIMAEASRRV